MLQRCEDAAVERLFCAMEAFEGELFAILDDEEWKFIEFQVLLVGEEVGGGTFLGRNMTRGWSGRGSAD